MRKAVYLIGLLLLTGSIVQGQYKKSSIFTRSGVYYDFGYSVRSLSGDGRTSEGVVSLGMGFVKPESNRYFSYDMQLGLGVNYNYMSNDIYNGGGAQVRVKGKTGVDYGVRVNYGWLLTSGNVEEVKLLPFVQLSAGIYGDMGEPNYTTEPSNGSPEKEPSRGGNYYAFGGSVGAAYYFSDNFGLRISGEYTAMIAGKNPVNQLAFRPLKSHPSVMFSLRYRILGGD